MADSSSSSVSIDSINSMIGASNTSRVSGLSSGIDVDSIVAKLMTAESQPLVQMQQNLQLTEWQRDDYRSMNTLLSSLQAVTQNMKLKGAYLSKAVTSSNSSVISATAGATAGNATYTLNNIKLATAAYNLSDGPITDTTLDPSKSIWQLNETGAFKNSVVWTPKTVTDESQVITTDTTTVSLKNTGIEASSVIGTGKLSIGGDSSYTVTTDQNEYNSGNDKVVLLDSETGKLTFKTAIPKDTEIKASYTYNTVEFTMQTTGTDGSTKNQKTFTFGSSTSLNTILSTISQSTIGVNAFYDQTNKQVMMTRTETGDLNSGAAEIQFVNPDGIPVTNDFLTQTLKMSTSNETKGTDAEYTINGFGTPSKSHSNIVNFGGVVATLQGNSNEPVTLKVTNDTEAVYKSISDFVDKYNDTIKQINDKISEKRNRSYAPLTDAQKSSMKDSDITNWTDKAKSGMLSNDSILSSALSQLRMDLYSPLGGASDTKMDQLSEIGISTSADYLDNGKLVIDEDKLKEALSTNPQAVMELFTKTGDTSSEQGIMQRLNTSLKNTMDRIEAKAGNNSMVYSQYSMGKSIDDMNDRINTFKLRLQDIQTRYYNQFNAMESAIQQANSQASYLSQFTSS
ncbi:flagellar filament capping protein FliD [Sporolactobacillus terrae]|uniref:flagellar filament capping protein FliD n=1 Tax=Sporolactobacillus terrae TaxID=269673 RepID=UPI00048C408E|nr:flagellar filament capping protein FliD [Sporolactobacillus terrae]